MRASAPLGPEVQPTADPGGESSPLLDPRRERYVAALPLWLRRCIDPVTRLGYPSYYRRSEICFIHVPKNAGTSVALTLYGHKIHHLSASFLRQANPVRFDKALKVAILRDPAERLVSAYNFIRTKGTALVTVADRPAFREPDFQSLDRFLDGWLDRHMERRVDAVFHRQSDYICDDDGRILIDRLFLASELQPLEALLTQKAGAAVAIPRLNRGAPYSLSLSPATLELLGAAVRRHYAQDQQLFSALGGRSTLLPAG